jgi:hypothetical protein
MKLEVFNAFKEDPFFPQIHVQVWQFPRPDSFGLSTNFLQLF